jgi:hypothetical protein
MASERETIDISNNPDVLHLAEEVRRRNRSAVLRNGDDDVAVMMPVAEGAKPTAKRSTIKRKSEADMVAFFSSFGSWKDVDTDQLKADIAESRRRSIGPAPEL